MGNKKERRVNKIDKSRRLNVRGCVAQERDSGDYSAKRAIIKNRRERERERERVI